MFTVLLSDQSKQWVCIELGLQSVEYIPEWARNFFQGSSVLLFDYDFIKPGCTIGFTRFGDVFYGSLGLMAIAWASLILSSMLHSMLYRISDQQFDRIQEKDVSYCGCFAQVQKCDII